MSFRVAGSSAAFSLLVSLLVVSGGRGQERPSAEEAKKALVKAVRFFHGEIARHGGYGWEYSGDLALREGEGRATPSQAWVQPPGTPTVGLAFLDAYDATADPACLRAAVDAGQALLRGQMRTGGWGYSIEFDPALRREFAYRAEPAVRTSRWKKATVLDDDTTAAALRFLARLDRTLGFKDTQVHEAGDARRDKARFPYLVRCVHRSSRP